MTAVPPDERTTKGLVRLEVQVEHLTKEVAGLKDLILDQKTPVDHRVESFERLMNARFEPIENTLRRLEAKLEDKSKPNHGPLIAGAALVWTITSAIAGFYFNGQDSKIARVERDIAAIQLSDIQRPEFSDLKAENNRRFEGQNKRLETLEARRFGSSR